MYRKKFVFSFFTVPAAVITFKMYDWQRERMIEKLRDTDVFKQKLNEGAVNIQHFYKQNERRFDWSGLNTLNLNKNFGFKPIELIGEFDHSNEVLVSKSFKGEDGFQVITPFYCYTDDKGETLPVLIDRGWIPYDWNEDLKHHVGAIGKIPIKGVVYRPEGNKYSKPNQILENKWNTINPYEISTAKFLPNKSVISDFVIKQIEYNPINKSIFPIVLNVNELDLYPVSPKENGNSAAFFKGVTFLNLFSNMLVWIYL